MHPGIGVLGLPERYGHWGAYQEQIALPERQIEQRLRRSAEFEKATHEFFVTLPALFYWRAPARADEDQWCAYRTMK